MYNVIKRDGKVVELDLAKIGKAIEQAFDACQKQYHIPVSPVFYKRNIIEDHNNR